MTKYTDRWRHISPNGAHTSYWLYLCLCLFQLSPLLRLLVLLSLPFAASSILFLSSHTIYTLVLFVSVRIGLVARDRVQMKSVFPCNQSKWKFMWIANKYYNAITTHTISPKVEFKGFMNIYIRLVWHLVRERFFSATATAAAALLQPHKLCCYTHFIHFNNRKSSRFFLLFSAALSARILKRGSFFLDVGHQTFFGYDKFVGLG